MNSFELRNKLHEFIDSVDELYLRKLASILKPDFDVNSTDISFFDDQIKELERRRSEYLLNTDQVASWKDVRSRIESSLSHNL